MRANRGDFFDRGGTSLLATRLTFLIADRFGVRVPLRALYDHSELHALATEIDRLATAAYLTGRDAEGMTAAALYWYVTVAVYAAVWYGVYITK